MDVIELKEKLVMLVDKYVNDSKKKKELIEMIDKEGVPGVKGILAEINQTGVKIDEDDSAVIKEIVFYYV